MSEKTINKVPNVPNLRFPEFIYEWTTTSLELLTTNEKKSFAGGPFGSDLKTNDYTLDGVPIIQLSNITEDYLNFTERLIFTSVKKADSLIANNAYPGDLIIAKMMPAGRCCIAHDFYKRYVLGSDAIRVNLDIKKCNKLFMREQINTKNIRKIIASKTAGSTRQRIGIPEVKNLKLYPPTIEEQNKIGKFLSMIDERILTQSKIINKLESLICTLRSTIFNSYNWEWNRLDTYIKSGIITLKRGNVIPKHDEDSEFKFPVYSSSIHNNGLMGYNNSYMFDKELITWSVDGGGNFFYRPKHKFNVTNVCGIMEITDNSYNYRFLSEILLAQHSRLIFDYQTKAHPSVIEKLYKIPNVDIKIQEKIVYIFELYYTKLQKEKDILSLYKKQKAYLLQNMFI